MGTTLIIHVNFIVLRFRPIHPEACWRVQLPKVAAKEVRKRRQFQSQEDCVRNEHVRLRILAPVRFFSDGCIKVHSRWSKLCTLCRSSFLHPQSVNGPASDEDVCLGCFFLQIASEQRCQPYRICCLYQQCYHGIRRWIGVAREDTSLIHPEPRRSWLKMAQAS